MAAAGLGMRPLEACQALVEAAKLPCTAEEVMAQTGPALENEWESVALLPGAERLVEHFVKLGVPGESPSAPAPHLTVGSPHHDLTRRIAAPCNRR